MFADSNLENAVKKVVKSLVQYDETLGILLYGSYAMGCGKPGSDVDILWITHKPMLNEQRGFDPGYHACCINGFFFEIRNLTAAQAAGEMQGTIITNNNMVLNAFSEGMVLYDTDECMAQLLQKAVEIKSAGPSAPSEFEVEYLRHELTHNFARIRRAAENPEIPGMLRVLSSRFFLCAVNVYCRMHRLWSTEFKYLLERTKTEHPEFHRLCSNHLNARTDEEIILSLEKLMDASLGQMRHRDPAAELSLTSFGTAKI